MVKFPMLFVGDIHQPVDFWRQVNATLEVANRPTQTVPWLTCLPWLPVCGVREIGDSNGREIPFFSTNGSEKWGTLFISYHYQCISVYTFYMYIPKYLHIHFCSLFPIDRAGCERVYHQGVQWVVGEDIVQRSSLWYHRPCHKWIDLKEALRLKPWFLLFGFQCFPPISQHPAKLWSVHFRVNSKLLLLKPEFVWEHSHFTTLQ